MTRQERPTLTERGQGLGSQPLPPEDRTRPFGSLALGRGRGEWGAAARQFQRVIGDRKTPAPAPAGRPVVTKARNAPQAIKSESAMPPAGPWRESPSTAAQRAPAAGFCPDLPTRPRPHLLLADAFIGRWSATSRPGAVSTETRLRRRPACGLRPICPGLSARRGPLAAGRPGLPGRAA